MTKNWRDYFYHEAQLVCGAVVVKFDGKAQFLGSAVYVAPGLFLTAKHVIEDPLNKVGIAKQIHENLKFGQLDGNYESNKFVVEVIQLPKIEEKIAQRWNISKFHYSHDLDLAILTANQTSGPISKLLHTLPTVTLNIHPIQKSNKIISYGFYETNDTEDSKDIESNIHNIGFKSSTGNVRILHLDTASVAGSAVYETDNRIEHMMSGGPVCNEDGCIIAINSASLDPATIEETYRTICTPIIRAMFMEFNYTIKGQTLRTSLYKLAECGEINIIGYQHLSQDDDHIIWSPNKECLYCHPKS